MRLGTTCNRDRMTILFAFVTTIKVDSLFPCLNFFSSIARAKFEEINMDIFNEGLETVESCLIDAQMDMRYMQEYQP